MKNANLIFLALLVGLITIVGCGGGGGGGESSEQTPSTSDTQSQSGGGENEDQDNGEFQVSNNVANKTSPFGISPSSINYYSVEYTFIDAFKQSSRWITQTTGVEDTNEEDKLDLDKNGWIKSFKAKDGSSVEFTKIVTYIQLHNNGHNPKGQYIVLYDGQGNFSYGFDVKKEEGSTQGRDIINITGDTPLTISITSINPDNYLRNIRVIRPGGICDNNPYIYAQNASSCNGTYTSFEEIYDTQIFHPMFLNELRRYGVIRGMVLQETPSNPYVTWEDRPKITDARWNKEIRELDGWGGIASRGYGIPFELLITYANLANTDPWINIAAKVDDDYIHKMANYIKINLNPNRKVYLEYYDEAWNRWGGYAYGGNYMAEKGQALWHDADNYSVLLNWYGMRTSQICKIFKDTFGSEKDRVKCTMNSQAASTGVSEVMLSCPLHVADGGEICANNINYLSIAPYFGDYIGSANTVEDVALWSLDDLFREINQGGVYNSDDEQFSNGALALSKSWMVAQKKIANKYNVKLIAYEGGQHLASLIGEDSKARDKMVELFTNAQRDERMYDAYMNYFKAWKESGGELFVGFESVTRYGSAAGSWGNKEYQEQADEDSPKARAFIDFQVQNPCWWDGCEIK